MLQVAVPPAIIEFVVDVVVAPLPTAIENTVASAATVDEFVVVIVVNEERRCR